MHFPGKSSTQILQMSYDWQQTSTPTQEVDDSGPN